ncbi:prenyltransferase/squalene oxidase repeat-containing protein [Polyangium sorediatum]|uniref:Terpene cyclase/mutase family protein n=1 Tax=Polyangium sorediatum TaxID=889274 RepID=A0ABT6P292_9BACT|nr:prenyltransferase/squalene oxidase repeat-containing protein [Polyangium sorediatum]MDI1434729.1 terpene cyclase/mutase family protein [Polyangium sorediatum]
MIHPGAPWSKGLPRPLAARAEAALAALGGPDDPARATATTLETLCAAQEPAVEAGSTARAVLLLVAAVHAACCLPPPAYALPENQPEPALSPIEGLLLAARAWDRGDAPAGLQTALDRTIEALGDAVQGGGASTLPAASPLLDFGLSAIVPAALGSSGEGDAELASAGRALGQLTRLACEVRALLDPNMRAPLPQMLAAIASDAGATGSGAALARWVCPSPDRLPWLRIVGSAEVVTRVVSEADRLAERATRVLEGETKRVVDELVASLARVVRRVNGARFFAFVPKSELEVDELERTARLACRTLAADSELRESWDLQRWGGFADVPRVGRLFPVGLCLLALHEAGEDVTARARALVEVRRVDGFRYFDDYTGIPPDSDDLGLALQLVARLPERTTLAAELAPALDLLCAHQAEDGMLPVWLDKGLREPVPEGGPAWLGPRCVAVTLNALIGLAEAGIGLPEGVFDRALAWCLRTWSAEKEASLAYYGAPYTWLMFARLACVVEKAGAAPDLVATLFELVDAHERALVTLQAADGGFGGVVSTACSLEVLARGRGRTFDPWPMVHYLAARQEPDGLWPREPLYRCPGKDGVPAAHGARTVSAAFCLRALAVTRARLMGLDLARARAGA